MSQKPLDDLQDLLRDLSDARRDSEEQRRLGSALLEGVGVVARPRPAEEMAAEMLAILRHTLEFDAAFLLSADEDGQYRTWSSTSASFEDTTWEIGAFLERVLDGSVLAAFDVEHIPEWQGQPARVREGVTSALHVAIVGGGYRTILICTHPARGFFTESHVRLIEGFVPLASQAMLRAWTYEFGRLPREESATPLLSRSSINLMDRALESLGVGVATWSRHHGLVEASPYLEEMMAPVGGVSAWWESVKPLFESVATGTCSRCGDAQHVGSRHLRVG